MKKNNTNILILINSVFIMILLFGITLSFLSFQSITTKTFPRIFNRSVIRIDSESMFPDFKDNQLVTVNYRNPEAIEIGNKIAYYVFSESGSVSKTEFHEVTEVLLDNDDVRFFRIKGTANLEYEKNLVHQDSVIGVYNANEWFLAEVTGFAMSGQGMFAFVFLPVLSLIITQVVFFKYKWGGDKHEKE